MAINVLSPQLANQIAAGEVVERPASVVKELVENCLDAGATVIDIDIEQGGAKLIRIRDNGSGIAKEDLVLSLARHATSKIATLDDLESIMSLGFRGEALASISSVSRLTLTSRTAEQSEAWQVYTEGREMQAIIKPAAHPVGTTVEVLDLFYNTPARRKFLRTEKTEFTHIDEVIRRIALARFDVTLNLRHNSKLIRQYRGMDQARRLLAICGDSFTHHAIELSWQHADFKISGWIFPPQTTDIQYFYVNGRMMRDRLLNHAIRQAYQDLLSEQQQPAYILYLELDPSEVDVNVHPAKHEVRFQQSRLVHDFVYQAVIAALQPQAPCVVTVASENQPEKEPIIHLSDNWVPENRVAAGRNVMNHPRAKEQESYWQLMQIEPAECRDKPVLFPEVKNSVAPLLGRVLTIYQQRYALIEKEQDLYLLSLCKAEYYWYKALLETQPPVALLVPLTLSIHNHESGLLQYLSHIGFEFSQERNKIKVNRVPLQLREHNLQQLLLEMLSVMQQSDHVDKEYLIDWLATKLVNQHKTWNLAQAIHLLAEIERLLPDLPDQLVKLIDLAATIFSIDNE